MSEHKFDMISFVRAMKELRYSDEYGHRMPMLGVEMQEIDKTKVTISFCFNNTIKLQDSMIDRIREVCNKYDISSDERFFTIQAGSYLYFVIEKRV